MKNYKIHSIFTLIVTPLLLCACSTKEDVPEAVRISFADRFPGVTDVDWEMERPDEWEAEFDLHEMEYSANFSMSGEWLETEHEINTTNIPSEVVTLVSSKYKDPQFKKAEVIESPLGQSFELQIKSDQENLTIEIDPDGIISQVPEENDED